MRRRTPQRADLLTSLCRHHACPGLQTPAGHPETPSPHRFSVVKLAASSRLQEPKHPWRPTKARAVLEIGPLDGILEPSALKTETRPPLSIPPDVDWRIRNEHRSPQTRFPFSGLRFSAEQQRSPPGCGTHLWSLQCPQRDVGAAATQSSAGGGGEWRLLQNKLLLIESRLDEITQPTEYSSHSDDFSSLLLFRYVVVNQWADAVLQRGAGLTRLDTRCRMKPRPLGLITLLTSRFLLPGRLTSRVLLTIHQTCFRALETR